MVEDFMTKNTKCSNNFFLLYFMRGDFELLENKPLTIQCTTIYFAKACNTILLFFHEL